MDELDGAIKHQRSSKMITPDAGQDDFAIMKMLDLSTLDIITESHDSATFLPALRGVTPKFDLVAQFHHVWPSRDGLPTDGVNCLVFIAAALQPREIHVSENVSLT